MHGGGEGGKSFGPGGRKFGPGGRKFVKGGQKFGQGKPGQAAPPYKRPFAGKGGLPPRPAFVPKSGQPGQAPTVGGEFGTSWEHVAQWYDRMVGDEGSDYHRNVLLPATLRLLNPKPTHNLLDLCCGQGVLSRLLAPLVAQVVGVDLSRALIESARQRTEGKNVRYEVADARKLGALADGTFDTAACVMAVHDVDDLPALMRSLAAALKTGGHAVLVFMHPCFRIPRQSSWGWDDLHKTQYRRVDRYITPLGIPISTHPGSDPSEHTHFFHRPISEYLNALGAAGLAVTACEELAGHRESEPGPRARAENRSRREIPIFLALRAVKTTT